jgi:hypothetical protein
MNALPDSGVGSALRRLRTLGSLETLFREAGPGAVREPRLRPRRRVQRPRAIAHAGERPRPRPRSAGARRAHHARRRPAAARTRPLRVGGAAPATGPVLVEDALDDPRALGLLPGASAFVAAPVVCHQRPVALMHADLGTGGHVLTDYDRETGLGVRRGLRVLRSNAACSQAVSASSPRAWSSSSGRPRRASSPLSRPEIELGTPAARTAPAKLRAQPVSGLDADLTRPGARGSVDARGG